MHTFTPPACSLCENDEFQVVASEEIDGEVAEIQKCTSCGLHIVWPRLKNHQEPYGGDEASFNKKYGAILRGERLHDRHQNYMEEVALVRRYSEPGARVLDVGCHAGWLLGYLKDAGFRIEGVEPSAFLACIAGLRTGASVHGCFLHEIPEREGTFDCITITDVIEHIAPENINRFISSVHDLLAPGGHVIIKTPNVRFTFAKHVFAKLIPKSIRKHFLKSTDVWNAKEHVVQWDSTTLAEICKKHALEPVEVFVPKPVETTDTPFIPRVLRKSIYFTAKIFGGNRSVPWFAQDICLVARRRDAVSQTVLP